MGKPMTTEELIAALAQMVSDLTTAAAHHGVPTAPQADTIRTAIARLRSVDTMEKSLLGVESWFHATAMFDRWRSGAADPEEGAHG